VTYCTTRSRGRFLFVSLYQIHHHSMYSVVWRGGGGGGLHTSPLTLDVQGICGSKSLIKLYMQLLIRFACLIPVGTRLRNQTCRFEAPSSRIPFHHLFLPNEVIFVRVAVSCEYSITSESQGSFSFRRSGLFLCMRQPCPAYSIADLNMAFLFGLDFFRRIQRPQCPWPLLESS
jgi:hypothetical protein